MLNIKKFIVNPIQENCYVVSDETRECVIIDCGAIYPDEHDTISRYIREKQLQPVHLLCTHGHFDHCIGNAWVHDTYGLSPEIGEADVHLLNKMDDQVMMFFGVKNDIEVPQPSRLLKDGDTIGFGSHQFQVKATPGHTPGGVVFYCEEENVLFTGDTLFYMSVGRTDLEGGDWQTIVFSLCQVIKPLPNDTTAYCGHGPETTIGFEIRHNPFMR